MLKNYRKKLDDIERRLSVLLYVYKLSEIYIHDYGNGFYISNDEKDVMIEDFKIIYYGNNLSLLEKDAVECVETLIIKKLTRNNNNN